MRSSVSTPYLVENPPLHHPCSLRFLPDLTVRWCTGHDEQLIRLIRLIAACNRPIRSDFPGMCGLPAFPLSAHDHQTLCDLSFLLWFTLRHAPKAFL
jgi:hypothetical protein